MYKIVSYNTNGGQDVFLVYSRYELMVKTYDLEISANCISYKVEQEDYVFGYFPVNSPVFPVRSKWVRASEYGDHKIFSFRQL